MKIFYTYGNKANNGNKRCNLAWPDVLQQEQTSGQRGDESGETNNDYNYKNNNYYYNV